MTTAPRLLTFEPDVTVQRARWSVGACSVVSSAVGVVIGCLRSGSRWSRVCVVGGAAAAAGGGRGRRREVALVAAPELRAGLPDRVLERVGEGGRRGRDDVRVGAHRRPLAVAVGRVDDHPRPGGRRRVAVEDPDLVVVQVDAVDVRVERPQRLAQRGVEGVDGAVAVGGGVEDLAVDLDLDGRLGEQLAALALLDEAGVVEDPERRRVVRLVAPDQQLEARLGALEREALVLELLDELPRGPWGRRRRRAGGRAAPPGSGCSPCRRAR